MKEQKFLSIIKEIIGDKYIGDDCAYLKELGIVVTQDSLVEDVHFKREYTSAYQLGYKSIMVNISDISASGAVPKYISIALSLPQDISEDFIKEFYNGCTDANKNIEIIGGDITGSDKIVVSITAIGTVEDKKISSRSGAKNDYVIVTNGSHGSSAGGLNLLLNGKNSPKNLINAHLMPKAGIDFAQSISSIIKDDYAMMDTSDGLADALYKIAEASDKTLVVDFDKIKYDEELKETFPEKYKDMILYGGEDYKIIAVIPQDITDKIDCIKIGHVEERDENIPVKILSKDKTIIIDNLDNCFNHFG